MKKLIKKTPKGVMFQDEYGNTYECPTRPMRADVVFDMWPLSEEERCKILHLQTIGKLYSWVEWYIFLERPIPSDLSIWAKERTWIARKFSEEMNAAGKGDVLLEVVNTIGVKLLSGLPAVHSLVKTTQKGSTQWHDLRLERLNNIVFSPQVGHESRVTAALAAISIMQATNSRDFVIKNPKAILPYAEVYVSGGEENKAAALPPLAAKKRIPKGIKKLKP